MNPEEVRELEHSLERALSEFFRERDDRREMRIATRHTVQMMSKAAVAVFEAAGDSARPPKRPPKRRPPSSN